MPRNYLNHSIKISEEGTITFRQNKYTHTHNTHKVGLIILSSKDMT